MTYGGWHLQHRENGFGKQPENCSNIRSKWCYAGRAMQDSQRCRQPSRTRCGWETDRYAMQRAWVQSLFSRYWEAYKGMGIMEGREREVVALVKTTFCKGLEQLRVLTPF